jgi:secreted PhoX family phosphatase
LYTARFNEDGTGDWLALDLGDPYFRVAAAAKHATIKSHVDVQANTRLAADVVAATAARRFELISVYPRSCKVFLSMTDNVDTGTADHAGWTPVIGVPVQVDALARLNEWQMSISECNSGSTWNEFETTPCEFGRSAGNTLIDTFLVDLGVALILRIIGVL